MLSDQHNSGHLSAKELVPILEKWRKEQSALIKDITSALTGMNTVKKEYDKSFVKLLRDNFPRITIILLAFFLLTAALAVPCFSIDIGKIKITKPCMDDRNQSR